MANHDTAHTNGVVTEPKEDLRDLGFGTRVSQESRQRLLNRDGTFNVARQGLSFVESINAYHTLLNMSWFKFQVVMFAAYISINLIFSLLYVLCGQGALNGLDAMGSLDYYVKCFFFSVQTFTTVGYGHVSPRTLPANFLVMVEAFIGLFSFALSTGLLFARFSRPTARILFSRTAVVAPYHGMTAFEFRIANMRKSQLIEVEVRVMVSWVDEVDSKRTRHYRALELERNKVAFFPLHWTVVHAIDGKSPIHGIDSDGMSAMEMEFLILLTGLDDTFAQTVHARMSYRYDEVIWGAKYVDIFLPTEDDRAGVNVDLRRLHEVEHTS